MRKSNRSLALAAAALALMAPGVAHAWNYTGHRVIATIAYRQLDEATRRRVAEVLKNHPAYAGLWAERPTNGGDAALNLFWNASVFPDDARRPPWDKYHRPLAHYVTNRILAEQGNKVEPPLPGENVINSYVAHLRRVADPRTPDGERAEHLSWVFHQEGDIHQPLHAGSRFSKAFPEGDRGGNGVAVPNPRAAADWGLNLHAFWDDLLGSDDSPASVERIAAGLVDEYPKDAFAAELARTDIGQWAEESLGAAVKTVYANLDPNITRFADLPVGYEADARRVARRRAALAGYRLADELKRLFPPWDLSGYRPQEGLEAASEGGSLVVRWRGERGQELRARLAIIAGTPTVRELAVRKEGGAWATLGRDLVPEFVATTGVRRTGHGLPYENRWDVFWDAPLNHPEEVRRHVASFRADRGEVRTDGARLEVAFPGLTMGPFSGGLRMTVYRGTNLVRLEAIAATDEPSVAYKYEGSFKGFSGDSLPRVSWRDVKDHPWESETSGDKSDGPVVLRARNRLAIAGGAGGSVAVFPPPHQFFFARELEVNLGYVWYRKDGDGTFAVGVRQGDSAEGYRPEWIEKVFSLYNAPPGTRQRMAVYLYASPDDAASCREAVMAFTHGDRYKPLPGYKTMVTHFHTAFAQELLDSGSLDTTPPWIPMMRSMGINIAHIFDFHGDGHPRDPGPLRLKELETYFEGCRRHSDGEFLILPGEEANAYLGGHYNILFPGPAYWTHVRGKGQPLVEDHPKYGKVYHVGDARDVFEMMKGEGALVWQTHPRTKGSTGFPDKIKDADYLKSDLWLGAAFKALPVDLSQKRLGEVRCFGTLDDMNNWGGPKVMVGEVDTYKKFPDYDLYGDFNVNYVRLDRVPSFPDWSAITRALRAGDFFVTTGEVLIPRWGVEGVGKDRTVVAQVEWTFPPEFVEAVWGDGEHVGREVVPATDLPPFGSRRFRIPFDATGRKWVRFSAWDSAGNGAFTQPVRLK